ncbi:MAG TPA: T9SS type A sorting domain-containing protein [Bacteroidia bacterium]|nr:T9SS type A sorting domain-containing protein [Bacteroidia bacterium]HNU34501.1 T9SS type A sorting domain-containing protein [Bacteroidia bacterium]
MAQITFVKHYGESSGQGNSLIVNSNGNYVIAGRKGGQPGIDQFCTYELNINGDTIWLKKYGTDSMEQANQIIQTIDGGYASIGFSAGYLSNYRNIYLVKTNILGDTSWTKKIGGQGHENGTAIAQLNTGEYIIGGTTDFNSNGLFDFYLVKTDITGDTIWTRKYGGSQNEESNSMRRTFDGGYILSGYTESYSNGMKDFYLVKTDSIGDTLWTKNYGGGLDDVSLSVRQTSDSGFVLSGYSESFGISTENMYVIKTNSVGDTLWTRTFGQPTRYSWGEDIIQTSDGGYAITGLIKTASPNGGFDFYLVRLDAFGILQWEREIKVEPTNTSFTSSVGRSILQTLDGGFAIAGRWFSAISYELLFIKTDSSGTVGIDEMKNPESFKVFPNPFNESTTILLKEIGANYNLNLYNSQGKIVFTSSNISSGEYQINRNNLPSGLYLIQLATNKGLMVTQKVIIE